MPTIDDMPYAPAGSIELKSSASFVETVQRYMDVLKQAAPDRVDAIEDGILRDLETDLQIIALPYLRFRARTGDIADIGFWPDEDVLRDDIKDGFLLEVGDLSEVPDDYEGFVLHVNDHGNLSLYDTKKRSPRGERDFRVYWEFV